MTQMIEKFPPPDFESFSRCVRREGPPPARVHNVELYLDGSVKDALAPCFDLDPRPDPADPVRKLERDAALMAHLGYDIVRVHAPASEFPVDIALDAENDARTIQGYVVNEHLGPIRTPADLECYPWPEVARLDARPFEWAERRLPPGMKGYDLAMQVFEATTWLMGYEALFLNLCEAPEFVDALVERVGECCLDYVRFLCGFESIGVIWGTDDLGHRSGPLVSPEWLREKILPWHRRAAEMAHARGKLYFLHSCGSMNELMPDFIDGVGIDAKHSFEDTIMPVEDFYEEWGGRVGVLGGIDVDFLCRADEAAIRRRVRGMLERSRARGGYCLGSGNSITSYVPIANYLAMLDEGRCFGR